jgi:3-hydroxypropanoate dehydrogenase
MDYIDKIFNERTCYYFSSKDVEDALLREIYDVMKLGATSANSCPLRILFIKGMEAKEKLLKCVMEGNIDKIKSAPVTAIFAYDIKFYEKMDKLFPHAPFMKDIFASSSAAALDSAVRNSTLQAAYFMMIAKGKGLDYGPMSGFDTTALNDAFFANSDYRVNFICNFGYRAEQNPHPRLYRMDFEEVCKIL